MSIYGLYVEGKTDVEIINAIKAASDHSVLIEGKGPKDKLPQWVLNERTIQKREIYMLRDRDFDFDVPNGIHCPQPYSYSNEHVGWYWCRHEIENYLLEPALVCNAVPKLKQEDYIRALTSAAISIRYYIAARWTIGISKRKTHIPPYYSLRTKPESRSEFKLPNDLGDLAAQQWMHQEAREFRNKVELVLGEQVLTEKYSFFKESFSLEKCSDIPWILHTFPGKDLFAGLSSWLAEQKLDQGRLKGQIIHFVTRNPERAVSLFPEWRELIRLWSSH